MQMKKATERVLGRPRHTFLMNPTVCVRPALTYPGTEWGHSSEVFRKRILWTARHIFSPSSQGIYRRCSQFIFFTVESEQSLSWLSHCGRVVMFTLDSNTEKDQYRSVHLCIANGFLFNVSLLDRRLMYLLRTVSYTYRVISEANFWTLEGIPNLTGLFKFLVIFLLLIKFSSIWQG